MKRKSLQLNRGYTLLFAVLVSSIVLSIGISILTISKKEFLLSSSARESTTAIYAADSGLECASFWNSSFYDGTSIVKCGENSQNVTTSVSYTPGAGTIADPNKFVFDIKLGEDNSCSSVTVEKYTDASSIPKTDITSRGYNIGWNSTSKLCIDPSPRRVERALHRVY